MMAEKTRKRTGPTGEIQPPLVVNAATGWMEPTEIGLQIMRDLSACGRSKATIAKALGTSEGTLTRIIERHPQAADALAEGKGALADELTDILLAKARKGEVVPALFLAKARLGWRDQGPSPEAHHPTVNVSISLPPAARSEAEWLKAIQIEPAKPKALPPSSEPSREDEA